ncbi:MAG: TonB-dependent receptor [Telluria sp.]|nr:TonB-dependent receptor [Telluria sp.]
MATSNTRFNPRSTHPAPCGPQAGALRKTRLAIAVMCALGASAQVAAQTAQPPATAAPAEAMDQVVVTGSRIRGVAPVGSPVVSVTRGDIEASGAVSTAQLLQEVPQVFNLGVSESSRGQSGGSGNITYGSSVNLRGIGPFATLTLINGHRAVAQGTTGSGIDPSIIPTLALQRVEIVADGASAIYGSDAVAGVVNMILRRNVEGAEGFVRYGTADSYTERQAGALWGHDWKGGQFVATFQHDYHSALRGQDRDFFRGDLRAQGGGDFRSTQCNPGNIVIGGTSYAIPAGGVTKGGAAQLLPGTANKCDNLKYADILPRQERNSGAFTFNQELGHGISLYADGFATRRQYRVNPSMLASNLTVPSTNPFYVRPAGAPAGGSETVAYSFVNDLPQNTAEGFSRSAEATLGADIALGSGWKAGALYTYGKNNDQATTLHGLNNAAVNAALASTDPATALNVFGSSPNSPAVLGAIATSLIISPGETIFQNVQLKADGPLYDLPGGKVRAAFGYEGQDIRTRGGQTTGTAAKPVFGEVELERKINSVYAEMMVPMVGAHNAMPGIYKLDVNLAARADRYSDVGSTSNPKVGVNWAPVKGVTVRGSYGTSFRAPGLTQIKGFSNGGKGGLYVQNYSDPTIGGALRVGVTLSAPNPDLKPETARTRSLGIDWEPAFGRNTKIGLTYFDILYENQVTGYLADLTVLNREAQFAGTGIIQRNPSPELVARLTSQYAVASGVLPANWTLFVDGRNSNLGKSVSNGFDFQASTRVPTEAWGNFGFGVSGTYYTKYQVAISPGAELADQLNLIFNPLRFKTRLSASWSSGPWYANTFVNYQNSYTNNLARPEQKVASFTGVDARLAYEIGADNGPSWLAGSTFALGVTNLFDRTPPFVNIAQSSNGGGGFDPTLTNPVGRTVSLSLNKRF